MDHDRECIWLKDIDPAVAVFVGVVFALWMLVLYLH